MKKHIKAAEKLGSLFNKGKGNKKIKQSGMNCS